jgi:hypothetical protein
MVGIVKRRLRIHLLGLGLNELGIERNASSLATMYKHDLKDWEHAINHYLETGSLLRHH